ncbi:Peroxidase 12 [Hordeum vulgare]|nr:Peroxidase 12 [Hordeum vulgare]
MAALSRAAMVLTMMVLAATSALSQPSLISMTTDVPLPDGLSYDFHALSCSNLQNMVRDAVQGAIARDAGVVPGLLRLFFHDCFPQGCDASILLTGGNSEQNMGQNVGLRRSVLDLIESIRATVHRACGPTVSCADITSLATKEAVMQSRLPGYDVPLGRRDSLTPATAQQVGILPGPDSNVQQLVRTFADRGFDKMDLVALSGAHTVGKASCGSFRSRAGENADFVRMLQQVCARNPRHLQDLDVATPNTFDNRYYNNLQVGRGVLNSDMALTLDGDTKNWVNNFAGNQGWFFSQFSTSMRKLAHLPGGNIGEIRNNCFRRNGNGDSVVLAAEVFEAFL